MDARLIPEAKEAKIRLAATWIDYCTTSHGTNCKLSPVAQLPTRLLDLRPEGGSEIRLIETAGRSLIDNRYITLSHCWGDALQLHATKTTRDRLEDHLRNIPIWTLPKTIKDAIYITRGLGLRYLWIDSLCIIQGDVDDWERESSRMNRVYANALCTIAATASADGSGGCFVPRSQDPIPAGFEAPPPRHDIPTNVSLPASPSVWKKLIESGPLGRRAWCFQERQMSPRVLHFTSYGLVWECCSRLASEDKPDTALRPLTVEDEFDVDKAYDRGLGLSLHRVGDPVNLNNMWEDRTEREILYDRWLNVVEGYSSRDITQASDRLPALSGLAKIFAQRTADVYLAGLWQGDLHRQLLWHRAYFSSTPLESQYWERPLGYRAPSWSWASIDGPVNVMLELRTPALRRLPNLSRLQLLDATTTPAGQDPHGTLMPGTKLHVSGLLSVAFLGEPARNTHYRYLDVRVNDGDSAGVLFRHVGRVCLDIPGDASSLMFPTVTCLSVVDYGVVDSFRHYGAATSVGGIPISTTPINAGLALIPVDFGAKIYKRIGVMMWRDAGWFAKNTPVSITIV